MVTVYNWGGGGGKARLWLAFVKYSVFTYSR